MNEAIARQIDAGTQQQLARVREEQGRGYDRVGWKVALNVPSVQKQLGLDGWVLGALPASGALTEPRFRIPPDTRIHLEAEIAIRFGTSLPAGATLQEAVESIEGFAPAIELVDYALPTDGLEAIAGHSYFHAASWIGGAFGGFHPIGPEFPVVHRNGEIVAGPAPELSLNDPGPIALGAAAFLDRYDERCEGGDWILCGSLIQPVAVSPGDVFVVDFGPMGILELAIDP